MKKNFVKKTLATTLALAMVATAMPAAFTTASAAKAPALNKKAKTLYINDNEIGSSFDFNISNKVAKSTYKWTTSNKAVATVNSKGLTKAATKTGKATISCKITLPTKKTKTLKATVTVKENATKVWVKNAPEKEIGIGEKAYDFNSAFSTASGAKATDYRTWEIDAESNTAGATIDAKSGVVTTTKAGEFKVRVRAYQNKAKLAANDTVDSEWLTVKVVSSLLSVTQNSVTKLTATFDDNMKDVVKAENFAIKNKATNVVSAVKGVSFSDDGKTVTVETFAQFADGATYVVTYGGKDFDVATTIGDVATVEVTTATVVENKETEIKYVLKNANGVDITDAKSSSVVIDEVENKDGWLNGNKLTIFNKGSVAKVKVTYHTYKYATNGTEEGAVSVEAVITAVEESSATIGNYKNYIIADKAPNWNKVTENKNVICIGDSGKKVFVNATNSDNKTVTDLKFYSGNDDVILVSEDGSLEAVKEGSTVIVVKNEKGTILWTLPVVVKAERKANVISLSNNTVTVIKNGISTDSVDVKVKDQHGDDMDASKVALTAAKAVKDYNGKDVNVSVVAGKVTVDTTNDTAVGTYQYKIALDNDNNKVTVLNVVVKEIKDTTKTPSYQFDLSDRTVDSVLDSDFDKKNKSVDIKVVSYLEGMKYQDVSKDQTVKITVTKDGKTVENAIDADGKFNYVTVSGSSIIKADKGVYVFTATVDGKQVAKSSITVNDTQVAPNVVVNKTSVDGSMATDGAIVKALNNACTVKDAYGNELKVAIVGYEGTPLASANQIFIKNVKVEEEFNGLTYVHTVTVSRTFTIK